MTRLIKTQPSHQAPGHPRATIYRRRRPGRPAVTDERADAHDPGARAGAGRVKLSFPARRTAGIEIDRNLNAVLSPRFGRADAVVTEQPAEQPAAWRAALDLVRGRPFDGHRVADFTANWADGEAVIRNRRGELRFTAGGELLDARGGRWSAESTASPTPSR